ncbi:conserved hypothetical protein [Trichinella spiralis]|uniref:hypothetical protein n=1 Tax=Trichinella spiralis TaxID=6334 RepID=UPI0001EFE75E|nr:conserved hypothetical protein [Trichinella spiralis]
MDTWSRYDEIITKLLDDTMDQKTIDVYTEERETVENMERELVVRECKSTEYTPITQTGSSNVRLPKMEIKKFNGEYHDWQRNSGTLLINAATSDSSSQLITKSSTYMLDRARLIITSHSSGFRSACALITFIASCATGNDKHRGLPPGVQPAGTFSQCQPALRFGTV